MRFSVVIPTFNRRHYLSRCLEAIFNQEYPKDEYEILVINDGSDDDTQGYLASVRRDNFYYFLERSGGPAKARNYGIKKSRGEFVAFTDDDCLVPVDWLKELEMGFIAWPEAAAVGGFLEAPDSKLIQNPLARLEYFETHQIYKATDKDYLGGFESPAGASKPVASSLTISGNPPASETTTALPHAIASRQTNPRFSCREGITTMSAPR